MITLNYIDQYFDISIICNRLILRTKHSILNEHMDMENIMEMQHSFGWLPDYPDYRDLTPHSTKITDTAQTNVAASLKALKLEGSSKAALPTKYDLRPWCPPIEDQINLGSCTANAGVGLL